MKERLFNLVDNIDNYVLLAIHYSYWLEKGSDMMATSIRKDMNSSKKKIKDNIAEILKILEKTLDNNNQ